MILMNLFNVGAVSTIYVFLSNRATALNAFVRRLSPTLNEIHWSMLASIPNHDAESNKLRSAFATSQLARTNKISFAANRSETRPPLGMLTYRLCDDKCCMWPCVSPLTKCNSEQKIHDIAESLSDVEKLLRKLEISSRCPDVKSRAFSTILEVHPVWVPGMLSN